MFTVRERFYLLGKCLKMREFGTLNERKPFLRNIEEVSTGILPENLCFKKIVKNLKEINKKN